MPATILVIGKEGQIGRALCGIDPQRGLVITGTGRGQLDLTRDSEVAGKIAALEPRLVVNAAGYTEVDKAESEPGLAFAVNAAGARAVAGACRAIGVPLVHISTDYVFDGRKAAPYREDDPASPTSVYGRSKAAGEDAVRATCAEHVILRTAWVFSRHRGNFVKTMLRIADERSEIRVVDDQLGCPTPAPDIARAIAAIARQVLTEAAAPWGTYHYAGRDAVSWFAFAQAIFAAREAATGRPPPRLIPIATADYPTPARRPASSVLDCAKLATTFGIEGSDWRKALPGIVAQLTATPSRRCETA